MAIRKYFNTLRFTKEDGIVDHGLIGKSWGKEESGGSILFSSPSCIQDPYLDFKYNSASFFKKNSYLYNMDNITLRLDGLFCISFWFKLHDSAIVKLDTNKNKNKYIPGLEFSDDKGNVIKILVGYYNDSPEKISTAFFMNGESLYEYPYNINTEWHQIMFSRGAHSLDRFFFDGRKVVEYENTDINIGTTLTNLKFGNPDYGPNSEDYEYELDQLQISDDSTYEDDFEIGDLRQIVQKFPPVELPDHSEAESIYIKSTKYSAPFNYTDNETVWDKILYDIPITRPVYYTKTRYADLNMINKIRFEENNSVSHSSFKSYRYPEIEQ